MYNHCCIFKLLDNKIPEIVQGSLNLSKFFPKKRYGQNFLIDKSYVDKIVQIIDNESPRHVIEIGPGRGEITISLAKKVERVTAIEIDTDLVKLIEEKIKSADLNNIRLIRGDVLNLDLNDLIEDATIVVGNLPYNIATVIISRLEMLRYKIRKAILMVQKEVAERLVAVPGSKAYGSLSIFTQYNCRPKMLLLLKGTCFWPRPEVDSALVELDYLFPYTRRALDEKLFRYITMEIFKHRRKTILNCLSHVGFHMPRHMLEEILLRSGIDPHLRPERLSIDQFLELSDQMYLLGLGGSISSQPQQDEAQDP